MALKPYKRTSGTNDSAADFCEQLTRDSQLAAFLGGNVISVTHNGTSATVDVEHGLGRAYTGADMVCASSATSYAVCVLPETAEAAGVNIRRFIRFTQAAATAMTSRWRVY